MGGGQVPPGAGSGLRRAFQAIPAEKWAEVRSRGTPEQWQAIDSFFRPQTGGQTVPRSWSGYTGTAPPALQQVEPGRVARALVGQR